eukprot:gene15358-biopygen17179
MVGIHRCSEGGGGGRTGARTGGKPSGRAGGRAGGRGGYTPRALRALDGRVGGISAHQQLGPSNVGPGRVSSATEGWCPGWPCGPVDLILLDRGYSCHNHGRPRPLLSPMAGQAAAVARPQRSSRRGCAGGAAGGPYGSRGTQAGAAGGGGGLLADGGGETWRRPDGGRGAMRCDVNMYGPVLSRQLAHGENGQGGLRRGSNPMWQCHWRAATSMATCGTGTNRNTSLGSAQRAPQIYNLSSPAHCKGRALRAAAQQGFLACAEQLFLIVWEGRSTRAGVLCTVTL